MGESKTPKPFISACNQFKYLDLLYSNQQKAEKEELDQQKTSEKNVETSSAKQKDTDIKENDLKKIRNTINAILDKFSDEDGWIFTGKLGDQISNRIPDFDVRNYGFTKLTPFLKSLGDYEIQKLSNGSGQKQIYIRLKYGK